MDLLHTLGTELGQTTLTYFFCLVASMVIICLILYKKNSKAFLALASNTRPTRTLCYLSLVLSGSLVAGINNYVHLTAGMFSIFFAWQFAIITNDICDKNIDKNTERPLSIQVVTEKEYFGVAILFLAYSFSFSLILGLAPLSLLALYSIIFVLYSVPPIRLRRHMFGSFLVGGCLALAFLFGYTSQGASINSPIILESILLFVGLSVGVIAKDFKDYEGDKSENVKTVFTVLGLRKGIILTSVLLLISFLLPLLLLNSPKDVLFIAGLAILSSVDFKVKSNFDHTIVYFVALLLYATLRLTSFV